MNADMQSTLAVDLPREKRWNWPARLNLAAAVLGAVWPGALLLWAIQFPAFVSELTLEVAFFLVIVAGFVVLPYAAFALLGWILRARPVLATLCLLCTLAAAAMGSYAYGDAVFSGLEGASGYIFFAVPAVQIVGLGVAAAILLPIHFVLWLMRRRKEDTNATGAAAPETGTGN